MVIYRNEMINGIITYHITIGDDEITEMTSEQLITLYNDLSKIIKNDNLIGV